MVWEREVETGRKKIGFLYSYHDITTILCSEKFLLICMTSEYFAIHAVIEGSNSTKISKLSEQEEHEVECQYSHRVSNVKSEVRQRSWNHASGPGNFLSLDAA